MSTDGGAREVVGESFLSKGGLPSRNAAELSHDAHLGPRGGQEGPELGLQPLEDGVRISLLEKGGKVVRVEAELGLIEAPQ